MRSYIIYCDESVKKGKYYTNFYGGALVDSRYYDEIVRALNNKKVELNLLGEVKWTKMSEAYLDKYIDFINLYFQLVKDNMIKLRIMFKQEYFHSEGLTLEQHKNDFFMLYYQFFKNAFGLQYCNDSDNDVYIRVYFDRLPGTNKQNQEFKNYIYGLQNNIDFSSQHIKIRREDITDVDSHDHVILQGMDIVLGAMQFRLNDDHKVKDPVTGRRGKKTVAKEKLYNHINRLIREIYPNFNIGVSTSYKNDKRNIWNHPYRHWLFVSSNYTINSDKSKHK